MRRLPDTSAQRRRALPTFAVALLLLGSSGCAHLAIVKTKTPTLPATSAGEAPLDSATKLLTAAEHEPPLSALENDLMSGRRSLNALEQQPDNLPAKNTYNFSVARAVQDVERANLQPWRQPVSISTDHEKYVLTSPKPVDSEHDPSRYDLFPTDSLKISGKFFKTRSMVTGIGAPLVAVGRTENAQFREKYKLRRVYAPVTAAIRFSGPKAELEFIDPFKSERVALNKHVFPLAIDLSASTAMLVARERPESPSSPPPATRGRRWGRQWAWAWVWAPQTPRRRTPSRCPPRSLSGRSRRCNWCSVRRLVAPGSW